MIASISSSRAATASARLIIITFAILLCSSFTVSGALLTYNNATSKPLTDAGPGLGSSDSPATTTSNLSVNVSPGFGVIEDVDVRIRINHTNVRQLRVVVEAPNGTSVTLLENGINANGTLLIGANSATGANLENTVFDGDSYRTIGDGDSPYTGRFRADGLDGLAGKSPGELAGIWKLHITDYREGDTGTLVSWGVTVKSGASDPQTFTVSNLNDNGSGSLRGAIAQASLNTGTNNIVVDPALTGGTITLTTGPIEIVGTIRFRTTLDFGNPRSFTLRSVGNGRVLTVAAGRVTVGGVTIADGTATGAEGGGGIFNSGELDLENCTVRDNTASNTGGLARGGGVANVGELVTRRCTFSGNVAESGGGLYTTGDLATLVTSTLANNRASNGGTGSGGAVHAGRGRLSLSNCTISGNTADGMGGGVTDRPAADSSLYQTIVAGNTAPAGPDTSGEFYAYGSLIGNDSGASFPGAIASQIGTASAPINPLLGPLANNGGPTDTMALHLGSPAADRGFCLAINGIPPNDQRGIATVDLLSNGPIGPNAYACDCGAFELSPAVFANISTRLPVESGENALISGFIVTTPVEGPTKNIIARGLGLSLQASGVTGTLNDPLLELYDGSGLLVLNDNWRDSQQQEIQATGIPPANDREAAIVRSLEPASYTAILRGKDAGTGIGLLELYDLNVTSRAVVANISTRGFVRTGSDVMIGGFILVGPDPARILLRAIGPSLAATGVSQPLADPFLELYNGDGVKIGQNNNWQDTQAAAIAATGVAPSSTEESAILVDLLPGNYTAVLSGIDNTTGIALVEAFNIR